MKSPTIIAVAVLPIFRVALILLLVNPLDDVLMAILRR